MNPRLNITATERTKANVSTDGTQGRSVEFDCGVVITKTLSDMGLQFILDAPEDMTIQNELNAMSIEQRGKIAVTMLTTGMYIADGNTGGFSMNNASVFPEILILFQRFYITLRLLCQQIQRQIRQEKGKLPR